MNHIVTEDQFRTILIQASEMLNNRPLTYGRQNRLILTPNSFLHGRINPSLINSTSSGSVKPKLSEQWVQVDSISNQLWKRFMTEILPELGPRDKRKGKFSHLKIGDLVLEIDENVPRNKWKLSEVEELILSQDGIVRSVIIKQIIRDKNYFYERPVIRLIPLDPEE